MATLRKFKLLATQCAVAPSPTRSPASSPAIHLRRRKTLRMLLGRADHRKFHRGDPPVPCREDPARGSPRELRVRHKLKDLFVSSPPPLETGPPQRCEDRDRLLTASSSSGTADGLSARNGGNGSLRPLSAALRYRLLRKAWRPVLVSIPE